MKALRNVLSNLKRVSQTIYKSYQLSRIRIKTEMPDFPGDNCANILGNESHKPYGSKRKNPKLFYISQKIQSIKKFYQDQKIFILHFLQKTNFLNQNQFP